YLHALVITPLSRFVTRSEDPQLRMSQRLRNRDSCFGSLAKSATCLRRHSSTKPRGSRWGRLCESGLSHAFPRYLHAHQSTPTIGASANETTTRHRAQTQSERLRFINHPKQRSFATATGTM